MNIKEIKSGDVVYHRIFTHFGKGVVVNVSAACGMERMFEKHLGPWRVVVKFAAHEGTEYPTTRLSPKAISRKPNKKKIREMVAMYAKRGVEAIDGGDVLLINQPRDAREGNDT